MSSGPKSLDRLNQKITACFQCPRLVKHREAVAANPPARYRGEEYWGKPLPGFGDPEARIYIVGLAPAANGGNRTGRIFTGDRSGDWLYAALHEVGVASQPHSVSRDDGMQLHGAYIGASVRCAPPDNKPTLQEFENCRPYLQQEFALLTEARVIVVLGSIAYTEIRKVLRQQPAMAKFRFPKFGHACKVELPNGQTLFCSYHPSQQNTFTGRLTMDMLLDVFRQALRSSELS